MAQAGGKDASKVGEALEKARAVAQNIQKKVERVPGVVDCHILQRLDYPEFIIEVDRAKVADLGLNQAVVMKNVVAALNSSIFGPSSSAARTA